MAHIQWCILNLIYRVHKRGYFITLTTFKHNVQRITRVIIHINADILHTLAIKACVKSNDYEKGLEIHNDIQLHSNINSNTFLQTLDNRTHVSIIDACIKTNNFKFGNDIIKISNYYILWYIW